MRILNISDYKDENKNVYYEELNKNHPHELIIPYAFDKERNPAEMLMEIMSMSFDLIVGHGYGGVLALYAGRAMNTKTILINPTYPASRYWTGEMSDYKYKKIMEDNTEREFCNNRLTENFKNIHIILGRDDDIIDTSTSDKYLCGANYHYVEGGHWPCGEDFNKAFKEILFEDYPSDADEDAIMERRRDEDTYELFKEFASGKRDHKMMYLYSHEESTSMRMSRAAKRLTSNKSEEYMVGPMKYINADQLDMEIAKIRDCFTGISFLVIDHISSVILTGNIKKALWIACNEVLGNKGYVLLLSDDRVDRTLENDKKMKGIIDIGYNAMFDDNPIGSVDDKTIDISFAVHKPYSLNYRTIIIDEVDSKEGNITVRWHSPELKEQILYVYFKDGKWYLDENDGLADKERATAVLEHACSKFVEAAKRTAHDHFC